MPPVRSRLLASDWAVLTGPDCLRPVMLSDAACHVMRSTASLSKLLSVSCTCFLLSLVLAPGAGIVNCKNYVLCTASNLDADRCLVLDTQGLHSAASVSLSASLSCRS